MQFLPPDKAITKSPTLQAHMDARPLKPKLYFREIAKEGGLLVPDAWESPREADKLLKKGITLLSRSEHPLEMFYSGLQASMKIGKQFIGLSENDFRQIVSYGPLLDEITHLSFLGERIRLRNSCKKIGIDFGSFPKESSASFWQVIEGIKITVIADSAVPERFHILSNYRPYAMVDAGKINKLSTFRQIYPRIPQITAFYSKVQDIFCDGKMHVPIVEAMVTDKGIYFLQFHPGRDFSPADFRVDWPLRKGEIRVPFVRGRTESKEYATTTMSLRGSKLDLQPGEGAFQLGMYGDNISRTLPLFIRSQGAQLAAFPQGKERHDTVAYLYKPQVSMLIYDIKQAFTWGKGEFGRIIFSSRSKREMKNEISGSLSAIPTRKRELKFPADKHSKPAGTYLEHGSTVPLYLIKQDRTYHLVDYLPSSKGQLDEKAVVSYVSDGRTAYLKRVD